MLAKVHSATTVGVEAVRIEVEVDVANRGFPTFTIVGLPTKAVDEAKDRVRTAITHASFEMPDSRITVNLAPADIPKQGSSFDLPIAVGILAASGFVRREGLEESLFIGELSLEGDVRRVAGVITILLSARTFGIRNVFVPKGNTLEASLISSFTVYPVQSLPELILHLNGEALLSPLEPAPLSMESDTTPYANFSEIKGQQLAKRALEIAAAGFHNVHLQGSPGTGKTYLSRAFPTILPPLTHDEILETSSIYSIAGLLAGKGFVRERPFRSPHHTISRNGLIGGGGTPSPGEISLAHRGVLFLDELPEFPRSVLESLRQPIEDGIVTISRAAGTLTFPARFILIAASNPCPCGYLGHAKKPCVCLSGSIQRYRKRVSGPLLDRIDLHVTVPHIDEDKLMGLEDGESSEKIRERVCNARQVQLLRFQEDRVKTNGEMSPPMVKKYCALSDSSRLFLRDAVSRLSLSARSYFKIIKIARTVADLRGNEMLATEDIAEALQFRRRDE